MSEHTRHETGLLDASANREGRDRHHAQGATSLPMQWTGFFLAPATFFAHLQLAYVLVPWSCATGNRLWLHVVGVLAVLLAAVGSFVAYTVWQREGGGEPGQHGGPGPRARFLGLTGAVVGAHLALLLAGQWVAMFFISPCQ